MISVPHCEEAIELSQMPQLAEAAGDEDNWTGLADAAARRKRQNRLNLRAHRRRKALEAQAQAPAGPSSSIVTTYHNDQSLYWIEDRQAVSTLPPSLVSSIRRSKPLFSYRPSSSPTQPIVFPLSSDHLITLIQFNTLRACLTNFTLLQLLDTIPAECTMALDVTPIETYTSSCALFPIPPSLQPTALQLAVPHANWIDIIPLPRWRDNMILAQGTYDEDDLCCDCVGGLWEGIPDDEQRGVMVWNDPWDVRGWEVSEGFLKKWAFFLKGCDEVIASTNKWREIRKEEALVIEL